MSDISKTTINLPVDLKKELKKIAIDEDTSLSGLILKMIFYLQLNLTSML